MKTLRLLYPDYVSGGLDTYYWGAHSMAHIIPPNPRQKVVEVTVTPPDGSAKMVTDGIYAKEEVLAGIGDAKQKLHTEKPDRVITIGGTCLVSLVPFDYLHGLYDDLGIVWIDAHPDVSASQDGYPYAHAMVLRTLMGQGEDCLAAMMENKAFTADALLYVGLQGLHDAQKAFLESAGLAYTVQTEAFVGNDAIISFTKRFAHILVHLDIDVLDEHMFHATYFANPELIGDGSGGGKMRMEELTKVLHCVTDSADVVGFTIAEYLPFEEHQLHTMFSGLKLFTA